MSTYKRVSGDYTIQTFGTSNVIFQSNVANAVTVVIDGNLSVSGNATLTGNISGDRLFNGSTSIEIPDASGNANISVSGVPNVAVFTATGLVVANNINAGNLSLTGTFGATTLSASGNITGGNLISNGNAVITRNAGVAQPTLIFLDTDTDIADGQVIGSIEWFASDTPTPRTTSAIRSIANSTVGNADIHLLTSTSGAALSTKVIVLSTGNVGIANTSPNSNLAVAGNVYVSTTITAVGNITGGNVNTTAVSATGNIVGANLVTGGLLTVTGNITSNNISTGNIDATRDIVTTGRVKGGNVDSDGRISATGDLTIVGFGSIQGNVIGGNLLTAGTITATGNISSVGNVRGGNIVTGGVVSSTGNIISAANVAGNNVIAIANVTATGNVSGTYIFGNGAFLTDVASNIGVASGLQNGTTTLTIVGPNGNIDGVVAGVSILTFNTGGQLLTGQMSATGNVSGSNVNASGNISAIGNINAANIFTTGIANIGTLITTNINANALTSGTVASDRLSGSYTISITGSAGTAATVTNAAQGNITSLGTLTSLAVTGNVTGGNFGTAGLVTATGNVTGGNVITAGAVSAGSAGISSLGNITGANILGGANVNATTHTGTTVSVIGNIDGGNLRASGLISVVGNITGGNILGVANVNSTTFTGSTINVTANITGGNIITGGVVSSTGIISSAGNVTGSNINGSNLYSVGIISAAGNITGGNISTANINATTHTGGTVSVTGNITAGNYNTSGLFSTTGNVVGGNVNTAGVLLVNTGNTAIAIVNGAANGVGNIGSSTGYFNRLFATATTALYADLAEKYTADADYVPGTVVSFGGNNEITLSAWDSDRRVAGVVSTNPSYLMNAGLDAEHVAVVALQGRVACRVQGPVRKGDMMVSAGNGAARSEADPKTGAVIGKALENFSGESGTIEVVVGRI